MANLSLRPIHYACVSGGKDSLYMLNLILNNLDKYPLDLVVHYELEIDWHWVNDVIDFMEKRCKEYGIPFWRIKPRTSYYKLLEQYDLPSRMCRWCNSKYKLDAERQVTDWVKSQNCRPIAYIGLCADETNRFKYEIGSNWKLGDKCYPLAEENIPENVILDWAKNCYIFNNWYNVFKRQGCMFCPNLTQGELAYMKIFYPASYEFLKNEVLNWENTHGKKLTEQGRKGSYFNYPWEKNDEIVTNKWIPKIKERLEML